jgi:serine/threonine-protein kinase
MMSQSEGSRSVDDTLTWSGGDAPGQDLTGMTLGDFQVERTLGRGGMGEVYLARQISLSRPVALKVLRPDLLTKETYLKRFEAEATAVAKLNHPNIVHVYTLGELGKIRFIAMEYVQGTTLREYIAKKGALDLPLALSIMKQAGVAIGAAGEIGLIHRDIKPENILLTRKGQVKIADFGLCRDQDATTHHLTQPGVTLGTPLYMSPEQAQGQALDHRSDLYSLGVTSYHMLAGVPPFRAESALALALKHVKDAPVSLSIHRPEVPPELDRLVMKLMAKRPEDRYQSAAEMLRDLSKVKGLLNAPSISLAAAAETSPALARTEVDPKVMATTKSQLASPESTVPGEVPRTGFQLSTRALSGVVGLCLVVGALCGWLSRPADLLSSGGRATDPPALWMAPEWTAVKKQPSAEAQFRYALVRAPKEEAVAAWLAVPGHYPHSHDWATQAYIQLARALLRERDADGLKMLAADIDHWDKAKTHEKKLADLIGTAQKALGGDPDGVVVDFEGQLRPRDLNDPALVELGIEIAQQAIRVSPQSAVVGRLRQFRTTLTDILYQLHPGRVAFQPL